MTIIIVLKLTSLDIHSRLLRCSTARGSNTGLSLVGTTKVKACKSYISTIYKSNDSYKSDSNFVFHFFLKNSPLQGFDCRPPAYQSNALSTELSNH